MSDKKEAVKEFIWNAGKTILKYGAVLLGASVIFSLTGIGDLSTGALAGLAFGTAVIDTAISTASAVYIVVILFAEFFYLGTLLAEGTNDPDTGQILLGHGRELAFAFVAGFKTVMNLIVEVEGIKNDDRCGDQGDQGKQGMHGDHECDGQYEQQCNAENGSKLPG